MTPPEVVSLKLSINNTKSSLFTPELDTAVASQQEGLSMRIDQWINANIVNTLNAQGSHLIYKFKPFQQLFKG